MNKRTWLTFIGALLPVTVLYVLYRTELWEYSGLTNINFSNIFAPVAHGHGRYCRLASHSAANTNTKVVSNSSRTPFTRHIVAVGDIHGDMANARKVLRFAGVVDDSDEAKWTGNVDWFVQTGDIIDRGDDTIALYRWMERLRSQAKSVGGDVISHMGNHEYMNALGDWRYVYPSELKTFRTISARQRLISTGFIGRAWAANYTVTSRLPLHPSIGDINEPYEPSSSSLPDSLRRNQGQSGAQVPLSSSSQDTDVDDPLSHTAISFVHGGLSPTYQDLTPFPSKINELGKSLLHKLQNRKQPDPHPPARKPGLPEDATDEERGLYAANGPLWYRGWASQPEEIICAQVDDVLTRTGTRRMIMGHTPDFEKIVSRCGGKIIIIDTGISRAYGGVLSALSIQYTLEPLGDDPGEGEEDTQKWKETEVITALYEDKREELVREEREIVGQFSH
ncbi:Metallo-dependent phosphatase-like protein [Panaeolus papilionaceus]|nr:Metallo-dependent phosphatase-like protein [Panaeolus papilionaceus]